jgi:D-alanine transaminase
LPSASNTSERPPSRPPQGTPKRPRASTSRIAYVNGRYVPHRRASVHIEDRGYQFADGVYEVIAVAQGRLVDWDLHAARLERSLAEARMDWPISPRALPAVIGEVVRRNRIGAFGIAYLQITRGVAARNHVFPPPTGGALVITARALHAIDLDRHRNGVDVVTRPDLRWKRCDIKSVALLANVLGKQAAVDLGAYEAWLVDDAGMVTEGTASNAFIVDRDGALVTHPADPAILNGITRQVVLDLARQSGLAVVERPFAVAEALAAREAFLTSTTSLVRPVVRIDGQSIGNGAIGSTTDELLRRYVAHIENQTH